MRMETTRPMMTIATTTTTTTKMTMKMALKPRRARNAGNAYDQGQFWFYKLKKTQIFFIQTEGKGKGKVQRLLKLTIDRLFRVLQFKHAWVIDMHVYT